MDLVRSSAIRMLKAKGKKATKYAVDSVVASMRFSGLGCESPKEKITAAAEIAVESYYKFNGSGIAAYKKREEKPALTGSTNFSGVSCPRCGKPMVFANIWNRKSSYCLNGCMIDLPFKDN